nr:MAG TPA: hypothetical protein [Caudoviricetes sp.]
MRLEDLESKISFFENQTNCLIRIIRHKWNIEKKTVDGFGIVKSKIFFTLFGDFGWERNQENFVYNVTYNIRDETKDFDYDKEIIFPNSVFNFYLNNVMDEYYKNVILPEIYGNMNIFSEYCEKNSKFIQSEVV